MKIILKSLAIVIAVGAIAGYSTYSFFSDTETSAGNTFTAGAIDLRVDSEAHYNNLVCARNGAGLYVWQEETNCEPEGDNLIQNGSFETPTVENSEHWQIFSGVDISPWNIEGTPDSPSDIEGLEFQEDGISLGSTAADGDQYVELDGFYPITLSQEFDASASGKYLVKFKYAPRPGHNDNQLKVKLGDTEILNVALVSSNPFAWTSFSQEISGPTSGDVVISFQETGVNDQLGMFLDEVDVRALECEESSTAELANTECDGTWDLTDLGVAHKFFNFDDIKPGDFGEDTVSLHVKNNDAWLKLVIDQIVDNEGNPRCSEPEKVDDPGCETEATGDLRSELLFNVWLDNGAGLDGEACDNIRNGEELPIISDGPINANGEIWNLKDFNNSFLPKNQTTCFGIGWKLPDSVENEIQTDVFGADMTFEVEQVRNNPNPF